MAEPMRQALCDAQTSGGLLIAVSSEKADEMLSSLRESGVESAVVIGKIDEIEQGGAPCIHVDV